MMDDLKDTVDGMLSCDYYARLVAEFRQVRIRAGALCEMLLKWDLGMLDFTPTCTRELLDEQYNAMIRYGQILWKRIQIENKRREGKE